MALIEEVKAFATELVKRKRLSEVGNWSASGDDNVASMAYALWCKFHRTRDLTSTDPKVYLERMKWCLEKMIEFRAAAAKSRDSAFNSVDRITQADIDRIEDLIKRLSA